MNCSDPSDATIYRFDRPKCVMQAGTACTPAERASLTQVSACNLQVTPCATAADRTTAIGAITACVMSSNLSNTCISAIQ